MTADPTPTAQAPRTKAGGDLLLAADDAWEEADLLPPFAVRQGILAIEHEAAALAIPDAVSLNEAYERGLAQSSDALVAWLREQSDAAGKAITEAKHDQLARQWHEGYEAAIDGVLTFIMQAPTGAASGHASDPTGEPPADVVSNRSTPTP